MAIVIFHINLLLGMLLRGIQSPRDYLAGYDHISNEHIKYGNEKLHVLMSLLYSSLSMHDFLLDTCWLQS